MVTTTATSCERGGNSSFLIDGGRWRGGLGSVGPVCACRIQVCVHHSNKCDGTRKMGGEHSEEAADAIFYDSV